VRSVVTEVCLAMVFIPSVQRMQNSTSTKHVRFHHVGMNAEELMSLFNQTIINQSINPYFLRKVTAV